MNTRPKATNTRGLSRRDFSLALLAGAAAPAWAQGNAAPTYPNKAIRIVVPISPGSATDGTARFVASALGTAWNTSVVVENRPGAGIIQGTEVVAKAPADGYTLLFTYAAHYSQSWVQATPYDPVKDFEPIAQLIDTQLILAVRTDSPFKNVADVIAAAKQSRGSCPTAPPGSAPPVICAAPCLSCWRRSSSITCPTRQPARCRSTPPAVRPT